MPATIFLLWLVNIFLALLHGNASPPAVHGGGEGGGGVRPRQLLAKPISSGPLGFRLSCGSEKDVENDNIVYKPDDEFIKVGERATINQSEIGALFTSVRYFPNTNATKYCYNFSVSQGKKYLVKTMYYYGGFDGGTEPPVFDQIFDSTKWGLVNTTDDYLHRRSTYYELVLMARDKEFSFCLARNSHTSSSPFISAIEVNLLNESVYDSINFTTDSLFNIARHNFAYSGDYIRYPDDEFNRYWQPLPLEVPVVSSHSNVTPSTFWNKPPANIFNSAITASRGEPLKIHWPPFPILSNKYYIVLYFQDNRVPSPHSWRLFDIEINGKSLFTDVNITTMGLTVDTREWLLGGDTEITLIPHSNMPVGPLINAAEIFLIIPLSKKKTRPKDVEAIKALSRNIKNPPEDWVGDPCLPVSWTGVICKEKKTFRIHTINLTDYGISGTLPPDIAHLNALRTLALSNNKLYGPIPNLSSLRSLVNLHLDNNRFVGQIPEWLGNLKKLEQVSLQGNLLTGEISSSLKHKEGLRIRVSR